MLTPRSWLLPALLLFLGAPLSGQIVGGQWETRWTFNGWLPEVELGSSVSDAGDVNGDGFGDVVIGAPGEWIGSGEPGYARVYSGATGTLLWEFNGSTGSYNLGYSVSEAGDIDGDGFSDVVVGAPGVDGASGTTWQVGAAYVYSGATGTILWQFDGAASEDKLGTSVACAGDVDGDGIDDIIVGATGMNIRDRGYASVYSGATGALIWQFKNTGAAKWFGGSVSSAGDVDGDGTPDLIVGASNANPNNQSNAGFARVFSGATGTLLWQFDGTSPGDYLGSCVSNAGDIDGDGFDDVIVGAPGVDTGAFADAGAAYVYSGATGAVLRQLDGGASGDLFGSSVARAGDNDGDGYADLIVGAPWADPGGLLKAGSAYLYSGATGGLLYLVNGHAAFDNLGSSVSYAGDMDRNGLDELIVGAPGSFMGRGAAAVHSLDPFLHPDARTLSATSGVPVQLDLDFPAAEAGFSYAVLASGGTGPMTMGGLQIPLGEWNKLTQLMLRGWAPSNVRNWRGVLDSNGDATCTILSDPRLARHLGSTLAIAAVSYDSATMTGRLSSIARFLTIVP